jgi:hypothetical protein
VIYGTIADVSTTNAGDNAAAAAIVGATSIQVLYAPTFDETGGQLSIDGEVYGYTAVNFDTSVITLATPLVAALDVDDRIEIYPAAPVKVAMVEFDVDEADAVPIVVPHSMKDVLADGMRQPGLGESVAVETRPGGELYIADIFAAEALTQVAEVQGDGIPPLLGPPPVVDGWIGALHAHWSPVENPDPVTYKVHLSTVNDFAPDATTLVATTGASSVTIKNTANDLPLAYDTTYYVKIVASDLDGDSPASPQGSAQMRPATNPDIAATFVYAGSVSADQITGGTIRGDLIYGGKLATGLSGARVEHDESGSTYFNPAGEPVIDLSTNSESTFKGSADINTLTVSGQAEIRGTGNKLTQGSKLELSSGAVSQGNPSTVPTVTQDWAVTPFTKAGDGTFNAANITSICWVSGLWVCGYRDGGSYRVYRFNPDGTYNSLGADAITSATALQTTQIVANGLCYSITSDNKIIRHKAMAGNYTHVWTDDFGASISGARWATIAGAVWDAGSGNGRAKLTDDSSIRTGFNNNMKDSFVSAKITRQSGTVGQDIFMNLREDVADAHLAEIKLEGTTLTFRSYEATTDIVEFTTSITYNATTHAYWKISEVDAAGGGGDLHFYTSADGVNWTERASWDHDFSIGEMDTAKLSIVGQDDGTPGLVFYVDEVRHGLNNEEKSFSFTPTNTDGDPFTIGNDGTSVLLAEHNNASSNDRLRVRTVNPVSMTVTDVETADDSVWAGPLVGILKGSFDFGASRVVTKQAASTSDWRVATSSAGGTRQTSQEFAASGILKGIGWDGSNFWGLSTNGSLYKHTTDTAAGAWLAGYTWYDSNATGGTHETMISPLNSFTRKRRARCTITSPSIPPGGGTDDPNGIRPYAGTSSGAMKLQSTPAAGVISVTYDVLGTGGAAPPGSNNFGAGGATPAQIVNPSNSLIISGDGTITAVSLVMTPRPGSIVRTVFTAGTTYNKPAAAKQFLIEVQAGGGAGGGAAATSAQGSGGGGGQGGGYACSLLAAAALGASETITVGAGGTGVSAGTGNTGGTSSFGSLVSATGGLGGQATGAGTTVGLQEGGFGTQTFTGQQTAVGQAGAVGGRLGGSDSFGGLGGSSRLGGGGRGRAGNNTGDVGGVYGGGGGGSTTGGTNAARAGAVGGAGCVIVTEIY